MEGDECQLNEGNGACTNTNTYHLGVHKTKLVLFVTAVCISVGTTRLKIFFAESGTATSPDLRLTITPWFLK